MLTYQQQEGADQESMVNDFEIDSAEILDEMTTRRGELKLRSSFNARQYDAGSEIPDQMATRRGELKLASSFNDRFRVTAAEEIMTRRGELKLKSSFNDRLLNVSNPLFPYYAKTYTDNRCIRN